jgi:hypothetical protein
MKSYRKELLRRLKSKLALKESGIQGGFALVDAMHIAAFVFTNNDEPRQNMGREVVVAITKGNSISNPGNRSSTANLMVEHERIIGD